MIFLFLQKAIRFQGINFALNKFHLFCLQIYPLKHLSTPQTRMKQRTSQLLHCGRGFDSSRRRARQLVRGARRLLRPSMSKSRILLLLGNLVRYSIHFHPAVLHVEYHLG